MQALLAEHAWDWKAALGAPQALVYDTEPGRRRMPRPAR